MILIAIGANIPSPDGSAPIDTCRAAVPLVCAIPGLSLVALSGWYRAEAIPRGTSPDYCNGMVRLAGEIDPVFLLAELHRIEDRFGRARPFPNAPRSLDLDIIDLNGMIRATPDPILPHPRAHLRAFVLRPLLDVAPGWRNPVFRTSVTTLLAGLPPQAIEPWDHDS
jgi:2-amino-4-hydroxy-6-hydroxymethyldihydropteridine diphosphokinase